MPFASVNGQNLYYEDTGGRGPALVFSHGLLMDHTMFAPQVQALQGRFRCICWDERGHGQTADPQHCAPFDYYDSADDLAALLAHLGVKRAVLVGMSQGGYLSLRCALIHPQVVQALVLIDTQAMLEDPEQMPHHEALLRAWMEHGLSDDMAVTVEHAVLGQGWSGAAAWRAKWKKATPINLGHSFLALAQRDDISPRLPEIRVPALVIHGSQDIAITPDRAFAMAQALPDARWVEVPGAGHAANLTHPGPVNAAIEAFLARLG
ncbi:alpha/beta fold hydrolase [Delftia sp. PS-11]|uniref:alpha/beta fold hydrolase n=1 Tax=Delftia sp. PS-11 TaxID=2767222 RepID=UPI00245378DE|nr:alpha/beta hydrolase [Delftia sp. PS-11]KAJ8743643.1 alpha/beta hydrolase [Delftia sp. PS-11]